MLWFVFSLGWKPNDVYAHSVRDLLMIQEAIESRPKG